MLPLHKLWKNKVMESISNCWAVLICTYPSAPSPHTLLAFLSYRLQVLWIPWKQSGEPWGFANRRLESTSVGLNSKTHLLYSISSEDFSSVRAAFEPEHFFRHSRSSIWYLVFRRHRGKTKFDLLYLMGLILIIHFYCFTDFSKEGFSVFLWFQD